MSEAPQPQEFIPRGKFQIEATNFILTHKRCQINIDMGLGKTSIAFNALEAMFLIGEEGPALVIAPLRVAKNVWTNEAKKWKHLVHLRVSAIVGNPKERLAALQTPADVYTVNFENIVWLIEHWKDNWPYRIVIIDESTKVESCRSSIQTSRKGKKFVRTGGGARTSELSKIAFSKVRRWINLTGTFSTRGLDKVWGQIWFLDGGKRLGNTFTDFQNRWFRLGFNGFGMEPMPYADEQIRTAIADITFTLAADDYLLLPKEIINNIYVDIPKNQMLLYRQMEKEFFIQIKAGDVEAFTAAVKSQKCHQLANGAIYYDKEGKWEAIHNAKIEALEEIIEEMGGEPIIVVYKFKSDLIRLQKAFPQGKPFDQNPKTEQAFKNGEIPILFLHPGSAGHGVDGLQQVCNTMAFFSMDWNAEDRLQTIARIGAVRQFQAGFDRPVKIHQLIARNTIDEIILDSIENDISAAEALKRGMARRGLI